MILPSYTIETKKTGYQFQSTVQEIGVTVIGATEHDALTEATRAIHLNMMEEYKRQKREAEQREGNQ